MKTLYFLLLLLMVTACEKSEELVVESSIWYSAKSGYGSNKISCTFYFFKPNSYDPTTFHKNGVIGWDSGELKTTSGTTEKSFFVSIISYLSYGSETYECNPGDYYIVACVTGENGDLWMTKQVTVYKNKITPVFPVFRDTYKLGYVQWEE